jgi:hypothetical protein
MTTKTSPKPPVPRLCCECGEAAGRLRHCTRELLCDGCRALPERRIMTAAHVKRVTGLPEASFLHLRVGTVANPKDVRLRRCGVYYWKDVAQLCLARGLEMPE